MDKTQTKQDIDWYLTSQWYTNNKVLLKTVEDQTFLSIVTSLSDDSKVVVLSQQIQEFLVSQKLIQSKDKIIEQSITWPSVWSYMKNTAMTALIIWLVLMAIYMLFAFSSIRKSVSPSTLAFVTIVTMIFDISIPAWAYGFLMMINPTITLNTIFIIAILTNMGYSINDTIIIFDRFRENIQLKWHQKWVLYGNIFEDSIWQTMRRSIWTLLSTLLVIVFMYILWTGVIKDFAFTIWVWVIAWAYSSIFISSPLAYILLGKYKSEQNKLS